MIDTHCHLNDPRFDTDSFEAISRAREEGISSVVVVGYDMPSSEKAVIMAGMQECIYAAVGVHPHDSNGYSILTEVRLHDLARNPRVLAIGEIGLDYHYDHSSRDEQTAAFTAQLQLAMKLSLPVIVHCREAYDDTLKMLEDSETVGVMHCWAGTAQQAERTLKAGYYLGFGGIVTFKNGKQLMEIARAIPLDRILLETDAPYLAPVPHRGRRNEPSYLRFIAREIADARNIPMEELCSATDANARRLFQRM